MASAIGRTGASQGQLGASGSWGGLLGPIDLVQLGLNTLERYDQPQNPYFWQPGDLFAQFLPWIGGTDWSGPGGLTGFARQHDVLPEMLVYKWMQIHQGNR